MSKIERINELLLVELAMIVNREIVLPEALITISYVKCSPDLKQAQIGVSVLPDKLAGSTLKKLNTSTSLILTHLRQRTKLRRLPHFTWEFDTTEREASKIERLIAQANSETF